MNVSAGFAIGVVDFGGMATVDTMNHFMLNKEMIVVGSTYYTGIWYMARI